MKLTLKNFKKYIEKEFDFGEEGLCLISGESGSGKTTILQAIYYCLYGSISKFLPHSKPKSKCEVTLTSSTFFIKRINSPKTLQYKDLITDEVYEGSTAQSIINEKFGELFSISSYIQQNAVNSFVTMSPSEKMAFLEKFAFQNIDFDLLRKKVNDSIEKEKEKLNSLTGQLQYVSTHFSSLVKPEKKPFPSLPLENKTKEEAIEEHYKVLEEYKKRLEKVNREIEKLSKEITAQKIQNETIKSKNNLLEKYRSDLQKQLQLKETICFEGNEALLSLEKNLSDLLKEKEQRTLEHKYHEGKKHLHFMKETEKKEKEEEIKSLKEKVWQEYTEVEITENIKNYTTFLLLLEEKIKSETILVKNTVDKKNHENKIKDIDNIDSKMVDITKKLHILDIQKDFLVCPSCDSVLRLEDKTLILADGDKDIIKESETINTLSQNLQELTKKSTQLKKEIYSEKEKMRIFEETSTSIRKIENNIVNVKKLLQLEENLENSLTEEKKMTEDSITYFTYLLSENKKFEEKIKILENELSSNKFSNSIVQLEKELASMKISPSKNIDLDCEETLRQKIHKQKIYKMQSEENNKQIFSLESHIKDIENELKNLPSFSSSLEDKLEEIQEKKRKLENNISKRVIISEKLEKYLKYKEESKNYKEWLNKKESLEEEEKKQKIELSSLTSFREKIKEAESIAVENIISSINSYVQEYLDLFFPNDLISVRLKAFKENQKQESKPGLNFEILYKENQPSSITCLSGGEYARVVLAFLLSMAEMFNSPIIMLDEPTASLDQESTSNVIEGIRKNFSKKLVIIIAHQVISGEFDREIKL